MGTAPALEAAGELSVRIAPREGQEDPQWVADSVPVTSQEARGHTETSVLTMSLHPIPNLQLRLQAGAEKEWPKVTAGIPGEVGLKPRPTQSRDPAPVQGQSGLDTPRQPRLVTVVDGGRFAR